MSDPNQQLIDAVNLIAEYCNTNLPKSWQIVLTFERGNCWLDLAGPDGETIDLPGETGLSQLANACITAEELDEEYCDDISNQEIGTCG